MSKLWLLHRPGLLRWMGRHRMSIRRFSLPLPQYDMPDIEPAVIPVAPPAYVLFPMDGEVQLSTSPVSLRSARQVRWLRCRLLLVRYHTISLRQYRRSRCSPWDRCRRAGFSQPAMNPVRSDKPQLLQPYKLLVRLRSSRPWLGARRRQSRSVLTGPSIVPSIVRQAGRLSCIRCLSSLLRSFVKDLLM